LTNPEPYRESILVRASPERVFRYFTDPDKLVRWMGDKAELDPRPGGRFKLVLGDRMVEGRYVEVDPPKRLVISWGRQGSPTLPPGASILEVQLQAEAGGTRVSIVHSGLPTSELSRHALGWEHYLGRLVVLGEGGRLEPHVVPRSIRKGAD
jgi:uncharacterized protein YndB with AHSA1/START domain